jgi:hypothetical protein
MLRLTQLIGFGRGKSDFTAPTITSASSTTVDEDSTLSFNITTDEDCKLNIGGTDASKVELVSNSLGTSHTLRWVGNGVKDFESPDDAGANNVYNITITPVDAAFNYGATQNFTITVIDIDDWLASMSADFDNNWSTEFNGYTTRQVISASALGKSGAEVRLVLVASSLAGFSIDAMYIGEQASSGEAYDMKASNPAPAQILVSGSGSFVASAGQTITTDALTFTIDEAKTYIISTHFNASSKTRFDGIPPSGSNNYVKSAVNEAATADVSGYSLNSGVLILIQQVQIRGKLLKPSIVTDTDVFSAPTVS